ncbi:zinc metalloprotease HtpX [Thiorhodococcus minor]|uniref:M48 family metalloprotease n=1 Tax=Thiorhodococcus minor TaxID=57489 RepID=A0A6M0K4F7_9GAMM|nr:zinc metalloprotease HtpX [Thiorhodococcus minor]NEV64658.1 M48 family metalloprotease [Thiorhodococcus minor]
MGRAPLLDHKLRNNLQSLGLLATLGLLLGCLAWILGGASFAWMILVGMLLLYAINPAGSPRLVLSLYRARPIRYDEAPKLYAILAELALRAGIDSLPRLYYLPTSVMTAFTTGSRDQAAIALSDGVLRRLDLREVAAVLAHELSHVANEDIRVMSFADLVSRLTGLLSLAGQVLLIVSIPLVLLGAGLPPLIPLVLLLAAPWISALVQLALSRSRELEADRSAVELTCDPEGLASALIKLERMQGAFWEQIVMPGRRNPNPSLLRTHPPTEERLRQLMELVPGRGRATLQMPWSMIGMHHPLDYPGLVPRRRPRWRASGLWY